MPVEELFDVVDQHDCVVDTRPRSDVHRDALMHRAAHVLVYDAEGRLYLQRRAFTKECSPRLLGHFGRGPCVGR